MSMDNEEQSQEQLEYTQEYVQEMIFTELLNSMYTYDEAGFCDGFAR